jgi:prophage antirepressor-like protein
MKQVTVIEHPAFGMVRTEMINGEPWFVAKDVCDILSIMNSRDSISKILDIDERRVSPISTPSGVQEMNIVNESGLYALIIRSNKPIARKFRKWVTSEVLPSIRKYGKYVATGSIEHHRLELKAEQRVIKALHREIEAGLSATDMRLVARQCQTDEYEVWKVLQGERKDAYMMTLLYARATGNKLLRSSFYTADGAEALLRELRTRQ